MGTSTVGRWRASGRARSSAQSSAKPMARQKVGSETIFLAGSRVDEIPVRDAFPGTRFPVRDAVSRNTSLTRISSIAARQVLLHERLELRVQRVGGRGVAVGEVACAALGQS